jgi:hypothetical protein
MYNSSADLYKLMVCGAFFLIYGKKTMSRKIAVGLRLDEVQLEQLKTFSERKGGSPISHHIRIAIAEYLEKYDNSNL